MSGRKWSAAALLGVLMLSGCGGKGAYYRGGVPVEPGLSLSAESEGSIVAIEPPARRVTCVDRHPLLRKPVEYYENTNHHGVVKVAAATVVGVPAGVLGEVRQIVVGCPPGF